MESPLLQRQFSPRRMRYGTAFSVEYDTMLKSFGNKDASKAAIVLFQLNENSAVSLELWIPVAKGHCSTMKIFHPFQWLLIVLQMAQKNPQFEISVKSVTPFSTLLYSSLRYIVAAMLGRMASRYVWR